MPELPEVESVARALDGGWRGRLILGLDFDSGYLRVAPRGSAALLRERALGRRVQGVRRRAKYIVVDLERGHIVIHLRMTGQFRRELSPDEMKHRRATIRLDDGTRWFFKDVRKFGRMAWLDDLSALEAGLGPEPLDQALTSGVLLSLLHERRCRLKPLLLDQRRIAGLGNIYVDESLWHARLHPLTRSDRIDAAMAARLLRSIRAVLRAAIAGGGTSFQSFMNTDGALGAYALALRVFGRAGRPCPRCGEPIIKLRVAQRGTHVCPACQKV